MSSKETATPDNDLAQASRNKQGSFNWNESAFVTWGARILGLASAVVGFAVQDIIALSIFGGYIVFELWKINAKIQEAASCVKLYSKTMSVTAQDIETRVASALNYEYLPETALIWGIANNILGHAQPEDEIRCTASEPNPPDFESSIFTKILSGNIVYYRLVCYDSVSLPGEGKSLPSFPSIDSIKGISPSAFLASYLAWYKEFYTTWKDQEIDQGEGSNGMKLWHEALSLVQQRASHRFEVRHHNSTLPSDYFILNPHEGHEWKAVIGFPRLRGEGMRSGFSTTHYLLAKDLGQNWLRLWEQAQHGK